LSYGRAAIVPLQNPASFPGAAPVYRAQVTVSSLTKLGAAPLGPGSTYAVRFRITNLGGGDISQAITLNPPQLDSTSTARSGSFSGSFFGGGSSPCGQAGLPPRRLTRGKSWTTCEPIGAAGRVTGVTWTGSVAAYINAPITWR
jgi:hypothetical protein